MDGDDLQNKMEIDFFDSSYLMTFASANISLANEYKHARVRYGECKAFLDLQLAKAYRNNSIERKISYEKALILLVVESNECESAYKTMIENQQTYKGLEKVIDTRQSKISLSQSLIKNMPREV